MSEQIYDKAALRKRAVEHLRKHGSHLTSGQMAMALGVQLWAAEQALEDAYQAKELHFTAGVGWVAMPVAPQEAAA
ncbi:hypothetical protein LP416_27710 [Polaromonas sp. P2-4]|nr:hypothetical protein LP416_27710 [Polaromonas sp. P2-4]